MSPVDVIGSDVEVLQSTPRGVWLRARVVEAADDKVLIEYTGFGVAEARAWVRTCNIRQAPPPHCATDGKGTLPLTTLEDVEVGFCGGHWPAKIISASPSAGQATVRVEASGETLVVSSDVITPLQRQTTGEAMDGRPLLEAPAAADDDDDDGDDRLVVADAHPPMCDTTASGLRPAWAGLGCEVECCEVSGAFAGAYASGELLEWMDEPTTAEAAAEAGLEYQCLGTYRQRGRQPRSRHEVRERGPWARVQTRLSVDRSPYAPEGRLVVERCVPIARLQPRPPPPPADFLAAPRVGLPVQVHEEGGGTLTAVEPAAAARGEARRSSKYARA